MEKKDMPILIGALGGACLITIISLSHSEPQGAGPAQDIEPRVPERVEALNLVEDFEAVTSDYFINCERNAGCDYVGTTSMLDPFSLTQSSKEVIENIQRAHHQGQCRYISVIGVSGEGVYGRVQLMSAFLQNSGIGSDAIRVGEYMVDDHPLRAKSNTVDFFCTREPKSLGYG